MVTLDARIAPAGDVTLMFTDIEGSTRGWATYEGRFHAALLRHNELLRKAIAAYNGYEVKTIGDAFMVAFDSPLASALCALEIERLIEAEPFEEVNGLRVRIGLHTGDIQPSDGDYFGNPVNRTARIEAAAHGGMILMSEDTAQRLTEDLPDGASLIDHGFHTLKDLGAPLKLFGLTHIDLPVRDYPRLNTLPPELHNFPAELTSFVGRDREIRELTEMLIEGKKRLITLTGPGGTGKTRLSLQVAAECVQHFKHGMWLVELAGVSRAQDVPGAVAIALGIPLSTDGDVKTQVIAHLKTRTCLLVLDNFEQVVEAARFVNDLMKQCAKVSIIVSSRELLQIAGEQEYPLEPLGLPPDSVTVKTWQQYASLRLFVERCMAARPAFSVTEDNLGDVVTICRRVDGLPLAMELTAALSRGMTPQQIVPRLQDRLRLLASSRRDLEPRQRSMRGAIDWSYDLLTEDERTLFAELSVFVGGFSAEAVDAVCETPMAFDLIFTLRDKSLVRGVEVDGEMRYAMLETLREYAREKREADNASPDLNFRHATYYLEQAQNWSSQLDGSEAAMAQRHFQREIDNMRTGMDWAVGQDDCEMVSRYGRALARFFLAKGLYEEGDQRLATAAEACRNGGDQQSLALLLLQRGRVAFRRMLLDDANQFYQASYDISKQIEDTQRLIPALGNLGNVAWAKNDHQKAQAFWEEGLMLARETRQPRYEAGMLDNLGILATNKGDFEAATLYYEQALYIHQQAKDKRLTAYALMHLGEALQGQEQYSQAFASMQESHNLFLELGARMETAITAINLGQLLLETSDIQNAARHIDMGLATAREIKDARCEMYGLTAQGCLYLKQDDPRQALSSLRQSLRLAHRIEDHKQTVQILYHAGLCLQIQEQWKAAYRIFAVAQREHRAHNLWGDHLLEPVMRQLRIVLNAAAVHSLEEQAETCEIVSLLDIFEPISP